MAAAPTVPSGMKQVRGTPVGGERCALRWSGWLILILTLVLVRILILVLTLILVLIGILVLCPSGR